MSDTLRDLLRDEAERPDFSAPPVGAILAGGRRQDRRTRSVVALTASAAVVVLAALLAAGWLLADGGDRSTPAPAITPSVAPSSPSAAPVGGTLPVSGSTVGPHRFGADADEVVATVTARFGVPDAVVAPQRYFRIAGSDGWFEVADDPLSPSWQYPVVSVSCWDTLCLFFGGDDGTALRLRGWELAHQRRWPDAGGTLDASSPDVRLVDTGIRLGDTWTLLHRAYPDTVVAGAEGASVSVRDTPWDGVFDGAAAWRLSGQWDYTRPDQAPPGAVVTRLSGGDGPEPGCC